MNHRFQYFIIFTAISVLALSCVKNEVSNDVGLKEVVFTAREVQFNDQTKVDASSTEHHTRRLGDMAMVLDVTSTDLAVETKATPVTSLISFNVSATTGSGTETEVWTNVYFCKVNNIFKAPSEKIYWAKVDPSYSFFASTNSLTYTSSGATISASADEDVLAAYEPLPSFNYQNELVFEHVFGRIGDVTVTAGDGFTITSASMIITPKTGGTYNIKSGYGHGDGTGWSNTANGSEVNLINSTPGTKSNDIWLVPGEYDALISWSASKDGYKSFTYTDIKVNFNVIAGKTMSLSMILTSEVESLPPYFSVSSTKKVQFAPGNLQAVIGSGPDATGYNYTASSWKFAEHQYDCIGNAEGNTSFAVGTTVDLFGWVGASASYDSYGLCKKTGYDSSGDVYYGTSATDLLKTDWGSIPAVIAAVGEGWFTLSSDEWYYLFKTRSDASSKYGECQMTTANGTVTGMLILPDNWTKPSNCTVTPGIGAYDRETYSATAASGAFNAWCDMEAAGAVFLPAAGMRMYGTTVNNIGEGGWYWSSTASNVNNAFLIYFLSSYYSSRGNDHRLNGFSVRLVKEIAL